MVMHAIAVIGIVLAPLIDLSGTWVLNVRKSTFASFPTPTVDSLVVKRVGSVYRFDVTSDMGEETVQHFTYPVPVRDSETTLDLPDSSRMRTTFTHHRDTVTFTSEVTAEGHATARQLGHMYLSADGRTLTRDVVITPLAGPSTTPIHVVLVYDKRLR
jgi:hypothetical protein